VQVGDALVWARRCGLARLDAQLLLAHRLHRSRGWLLAHDDAELDAAEAGFVDDVTRRAAGEPLAYLVGEREFHGLRLGVTPAVLVPRPDTEVLVDWAIELLANAQRPQVLDMGTGSGAIALAVKHRCPHAEVTATDISADALHVAAGNARQLGLSVRWCQGDWWQPLAGQHFDLVLSNPPYIAGDDPHLAALKHEPRAALTPEGDGLAALREIIGEAQAHMRPGAWLLLEHGFDQARSVQDLLHSGGFVSIHTRHDLGAQPRCTGARWVR
jgi:release factor glutamine methyltransferase